MEDIKKKKFGGRKKGTPNKRTLILQEHLDKMQLDPIQGIRGCLDELELVDVYEPEDKISLIKAKAAIYLELLQYIYPKRRAIDIQATLDNGNKKQVVELQWADENDSSQDASPNPTSKKDLPVHQ